MADARMAPEDVERLVRAAADGDHDAWRALTDEFGGLVWAIARGHRLAQSDAADVCQTTWLRLCERIGSLREPAQLGAWLATTTRRECLRTLRTGARQVPTGEPLEELEDGRAGALETILLAERDRALWRAFAGRVGDCGRSLAAIAGRMVGVVVDHRPRRKRSMAAITKLDFIGIPSQDADRARRFYVETLGLRPDAKADYEVWAGDTCLAIWEPTRVGMPFIAQKGSPHALHVDDVDAARAELEAKDVVFHGDILDTGVCKMAFFSDLDGNDLMLHSRYA